MKRNLATCAIVVFLLIAVSSVFGQQPLSESNNLYSYQKIHRDHPDGTVGKLSFQVGATYLSIKNQPGEDVVDAQKFHGGIGWVLHEKLYEFQSFTMRKEFMTEYILSFSLRYYFSNPLKNITGANPDGKVGSPVLTIGVDHWLDSIKKTKSSTNFRTQILFPFSKSISIFSGYTAYKEISPTDNQKFFGGIHYYFSDNSITEPYLNPDSPLSGMAISLSGGSSEVGNFGKIELSLPSSETLTIKISAKGDFLEAPRNKIYSGALTLCYYSGK